MKTSWNESRRIERYLNNQLPAEDKLLFEAQAILDPQLQLKTALQQQTQGLVKLYSRQQLKIQIRKIQHHLFNNPEHLVFQERIQQLFNTH